MSAGTPWETHGSAPTQMERDSLYQPRLGNDGTARSAVCAAGCGWVQMDCHVHNDPHRGLGGSKVGAQHAVRVRNCCTRKHCAHGPRDELKHTSNVAAHSYKVAHSNADDQVWTPPRKRVRTRTHTTGRAHVPARAHTPECTYMCTCVCTYGVEGEWRPDQESWTKTQLPPATISIRMPENR